MTDANKSRLTIVASIVTIFSAIWYLLKGKSLPQVIVSPGGNATTTSVAGPVGATGAPGQIGPQGSAGQPGQPGAPGQPGTSASAGPQILNQQYDPARQFINDPYANNFTPGYGSYPTSLASNLPPDLDLSKLAMVSMGSDDGVQSAGASCGCSNGNGPCKGGCNANPPATYPDGPGTCMSSTQKALVSKMNQCGGRQMKNALTNMMGNLRYFGVDVNPDTEIAPFIGDLYSLTATLPIDTYGAN